MRAFMRRLHHILLAFGVGLLAWAVPVGAQQQNPAEAGSMPNDRFPLEEESRTEIKTPGWIFNRPARDTASNQMAYARQLLQEGKTNAAAGELNALVHAWHGAPEAAAAQETYAGILMEKGKYAEAFDEYQYLVDHFSGSVRHDEVLRRQFILANAVMGGRKWRLLFGGVSTTDDALPLFEKIVANAPNGKDAAEAQFRAAMIREAQGDDDLASIDYETLRRRYPSSGFAPEATYRWAACKTRLAQGAPRDTEAAREALSALTLFIHGYKGSTSETVVQNVAAAEKDFSEIRERLAGMYFERAVFYDRIEKKPAAAVLAYKDVIASFPRSDKALEASKRIDELEAQREKNP